jgi:serine protease Do
MKNRKEESEKGVKIQVKKKYFNFKSDNIIMLICMVIVGMMSGIIASEFFVENAMNGVEGVDSIDNSKSLDGEAFAVRKVSSSLVTISSDKAEIEVKEYKTNKVTGIVLDKRGYIITNYSSVKDFKDIYIKLASVSMNPVNGKLIGFNETSDIAVIKIDVKGINAIEKGNEGDLLEGKKVIAVGNAISDEYVGIATPGIITSLNDTVYDKTSSESRRLIQTNAVINEENTGGAIINLKGDLLGICSKKITEDKGKSGLFYGVGISEIYEIVDAIIGNVNILGVVGESVSSEANTEIEGFYVQGVEDGGIAWNAGINALDIIISIDGQQVRSIDDIYYILKDKAKEETIECIVLRSGIEKKVQIYIN